MCQDKHFRIADSSNRIGGSGVLSDRILLYFLFHIAFNAVSFQVYGQNSGKLLLNEFTLSGNKSDIKDEITNDRMGFGIGVFHNLQKYQSLNLILGAELNYTSQFKKSEYYGHLSSARNLTYHFYTLSLRFIPRLFFGSHNSIFIDIGPTFDIPLYGYKQGTFTHFNISTYQYNSEIKRQNYSAGVNSSASGGIGFIYKLNKLYIYVKPEYKIGITRKRDMDYFRHRYLLLSLGLQLI